MPKNIPMKEASVVNSYDLEHLKNQGIHLFDRGHAKKIYAHLHKIVQGEDQDAAGKLPGPAKAPGQKIKFFDMRVKSNG